MENVLILILILWSILNFVFFVWNITRHDKGCKSNHTTKKRKPVVFRIEYDPGEDKYFVFKNHICIECCDTRVEAEKWLEVNKENYSKETEVVHEEIVY